MFINAIHAGIESGSVVGSAKKSKTAFKGAPMVGVGGKVVASTAATAGTSTGLGLFASIAALVTGLFTVAKIQNDRIVEDMSPKEVEDYIDMRIMMDNTLG